MVNFELLEAEDYYKSLLKEIPKAKKRIVIAAMAMLWGERTGPIFVMLQDAIKRGVTVTVLIDNFTRLTYLLGLKPPSSGKERLRQTFRTLEDLSAKGAKIHVFGPLGFPPHKGRCHIKVTVVDDTVFSFGGINFYDEAMDNADLMLTSKSPEVADCLDQLVSRVISTHPPLPDGEVIINKESKILFDGGLPKRSLIFERACELTAQAKKVYFMGQMVPSGQLAQLLHETNAVIYTNRPEQMRPLESIGQAFDQQKYRITNKYLGNAYIHARFMLFEMSGGRKVLLSGSHNFSYRGVSYGTQELALHSTNPALWEKLYLFMRRRAA